MSCEIGKIESLALKDFLTYDELRYIPGQNLNIIIGPNGTGKSTIVAGIILGCGGKPALLSRSKDITDFVKNGKNKAHIEIELKANERGKRAVFHRSFDKKGQQSFSVDGKKVTEKAYIERIRTFNIQVDNLCMFLPQDRVQDFTKLNPQELLHNTQISVCTPDINEAFESLKKKRDDQKNSAKQNADIQVQLNDNVNRNEQLHAMIETGKTKEKLIEQRTLYMMKKTWLEFDSLKAKFDEADIDLNRLQTTIANKKAALIPLEKKQKEISGAKVNLKNAINTSNSKTQSIIKEVGEMTSQIENVSSEIRQSKQKLKNIFINAQNHAKEVKDLQLRVELDKNEFEKIQQQVKDANVEAKVAELDMKAGEIKKQIEMLARKMENTNSKMDQEIIPAINNAKRKIGYMNDAVKQRVQVLRNHFDDAFKAYEWLQNNRDQFRGHIFNPVIVEISVSRKDFAKYVESTIAQRDLEVFLCTNKEDMSKLIKIFRNDNHWKVNVAYTEPAEEVTFESPRNVNEFPREFGVYAYLLDMIEGPAPVLNYLCKLFHIHNIVVGDNRLDKHASKLPNDIKVFFSANVRYSATISRYGGHKSIASDEIYPRNMLDVGIDQEAMDQVQNVLNKFTRQAEQLKAERTKIQTQITELERQNTQIKNEKIEAANKIREVQRLGRQLREKENNLEAMKKRKIDIPAEQKKLKDSVDNLIKKLLDTSKIASVALKKYKDSIVERELAKKKLQIFDNSTGNVDQQIDDINREILRISDTVYRIKNVHEIAKRQMDAKKKEGLELTGGLEPSAAKFPYKAKFDKIPATIEELREKIDEMQGRIECIRGVDPKIIEEYERRKDDIEKLRADLANQQKKAEHLENQLIALHNEWYPEIQRVVTSINKNFSSFFAKMGFVGEVELSRKEERDYADYGIQIRVQYRENEKLQALNRHVQSGGERAVAIAVYTLSLQHLTVVPFRCVDEINQGMDPKNERKIFQMLVDITCKAGQSQYFFITPKLLPDLPYDDLMTVTVVHNGKHIEESCVFDKEDDDDEENADNDEEENMDVDEEDESD